MIPCAASFSVTPSGACTGPHLNILDHDAVSNAVGIQVSFNVFQLGKRNAHIHREVGPGWATPEVHLVNRERTKDPFPQNPIRTTSHERTQIAQGGLSSRMRTSELRDQNNTTILIPPCIGPASFSLSFIHTW